MRASLHRAWDALCAGRSPVEIATRLWTAFGMTAVLYLCACGFMLLEPGA